jgi:hypothetical protein
MVACFFLCRSFDQKAKSETPLLNFLLGSTKNTSTMFGGKSLRKTVWQAVTPQRSSLVVLATTGMVSAAGAF